MKRSRTLCSLPTMSSACFLSVEKLQPKNKFIQRSENTQKGRGKQGDQVMVQSLSIGKDLQFLLKAIDNTLNHILRAVLQMLKLPPAGEFTACCSHDRSCHNSSRNGNKHTLGLKINGILKSQDDSGQTTDDPFKLLCCFCMQALSQPIEVLAH